MCIVPACCVPHTVECGMAFFVLDSSTLDCPGHLGILTIRLTSRYDTAELRHEEVYL